MLCAGSSYLLALTSGSCKTQSDAEQDAIQQRAAPDARVVVWARNCFCALADADDHSAQGWGWADTRGQAKKLALEKCRKRTNRPVEIIACTP